MAVSPGLGVEFADNGVTIYCDKFMNSLNVLIVCFVIPRFS
jgi:hypothetical protein